MTTTITGSGVSTGDVTASGAVSLPSGVANANSLPAFMCRAWCAFNGATAGTNAPSAGGNVSSVTRNGVGDYTINFTTPMPDTNYAVSITNDTDADSISNFTIASAASSRQVGYIKSQKTTNSLRIYSGFNSPTVAGRVDFREICVQVYR